MSLQKSVLELYAVHDKYSKKEVVTRIPGRKDEVKIENREDSDIYWDVKDDKELRKIPELIEKYLNRSGEMLRGSFYGIRDSGDHDFTYHIGGSTVKIDIESMKAGRDTSDYEGTDWEVFGYKFSAKITGSDSKKILGDMSKNLIGIGFSIVDKEKFSEYEDHYVGF